MLYNNFRSALRNALHNRQSAFINVIGLSLGLTVFIVVVEFISLELSYDTFHRDVEHVYRIVQIEDGTRTASVAPGVPLFIKERVKGVTSFCRVAESANIGAGTIAIPENATAFRETNFAYTDPTFFDLFSIQLIAGNTSELSKPNTVALSTESAKKYFGDGNAIGKHVMLNNQFGKTDYTVVVVFESSPVNTDLKYDLLFSMVTLKHPANLNGNEGWASLDGVQSQWMNCYVRLDGNRDIPRIAQEMTSTLRSVNADAGNQQMTLQPLREMHLGSSINDPNPTYASLSTVYMLTGVAFVILCIALFNYINLATASSLKRAKEVGLRKINGASRSVLVSQFLIESMLYSFVAMAIAFAIVNVIQTVANNMVEKELTLTLFWESRFGLSAVCVFALMCVAAGTYVGISLSSFKPITVLRGAFSRSEKGALIRKSLIVFQFVISVTLITFTIVLSKQSHYMLTRDLGMDSDRMLIVRGPETADFTSDDLKRFDNEISSYPFVQSVSRSGNVPFGGFNFSTAGISKINATPGADKINYDILTVDDRFLSNYGISVIAGRAFYQNECVPAWKDKRVVMLNEKAATSLGFTTASQAVGERIHWDGRELEVVGVTTDYHHLPVQSAITPILFIPSLSGNYFSVRVEGSNITEAIATLASQYKKAFPFNPFEYQFLKDSEYIAYKKERNFSAMFFAASVVAISIALLGIFGLITFTMEQRVREVGIRRVLGGSVIHIISLFGRDLLLLIAIAAVIALPVTYFISEQWLEGFPYKVEIMWPLYLAAPVFSAILTLLIVISRVHQGTMGGPVKLLRQE